MIKKFLEEIVSKCNKCSTSKSIERWKYKSIYEFILDNGKEYNFTTDVEYIFSKPKECFMNAYNFINSNSDFDLIYVEGYAISDKVNLPLYHAWAVDESGIVYDPTWRNGKEYYGVEFPMSYVSAILCEVGRIGVIDAWECHYPLLSGLHKYPIDDNKEAVWTK